MVKKLPSFEQELIVAEQGMTFIAGVDEVGRAPLAGPIVAGAVVFDLTDREKLFKTLRRYKIRDSKLMTEKEREKAAKYIQKTARHFATGRVEVDEIDRVGIGAANILAFKRALDGLKSCDFALIDGRHFRGFEYPYRCIIKGDNISFSIAAASIIAKVYRDQLMEELSTDFPNYNFASNKGYGTRFHYDALLKHGPSPHHRKSFLGWMQKSDKLFGE